MNNTDNICTIIRERISARDPRPTEAALHMNVSLESSVEEFVTEWGIWNNDPLTDQEMVEEYLAANAEYQDDLIEERELLERDFLRGFGEHCGSKETTFLTYAEQWAAFSRDISDEERAKLEQGGYESGVSMGQQYFKCFESEIRHRQEEEEAE